MVSSIAWKIARGGEAPLTERLLCRTFGAWLAANLRKERWDVVHAFSGIAEEFLLADAVHATLRTIVRGSAHIRTQRRLLKEEERRVGSVLHKPSWWMVEREEREYALADRIIVLSSFAFRSFVEEGVPESRLALVPLGVRAERFRMAGIVSQERERRIAAGEPLRVLFAGTVSLRKGAMDLAALGERLPKESFCLRIVGDVLPDSRGLKSRLERDWELKKRVPEDQLKDEYAWGDVFVFPTIEDGFAAVIPQALSAGLPVLATTNCGAPDVIRHGETGWILPPRDPEAFLATLQWCNEHRVDVLRMSAAAVASGADRPWSTVAAEMESVFGAGLA